MKSLIVLVTLFTASSSFANLGALNFMNCSYEVEKTEKTAVTVVGNQTINLKNGEWVTEVLTISLAYIVNGQKIITNARLTAVKSMEYPAAKFTGITTSGKSVIIDIKGDNSAEIIVGGIQQTHMTGLVCHYGLAG